MFFKKKLQMKAIGRLPKRGVSCFTPFNKAKSVVFIFDPDETGIEDAINYLEEILKGRGINWKGIILDKSNKRGADFSSRTDFILVSKKEIGFNGVPRNIEKLFPADTEYDILLDFSTENEFTSSYISRFVSAKFKIGRYCSGDDSPFDFITKTSDQTPLSFLKQTIHYLESIKPA